MTSILGSSEFFAHSGSTNAGFVNHAYQVLLDRTPGSAEASQFVAAIGGGTSRGTVGGTIYQSLESRHLRVTALYLHFLHRSTDPSGLAYWSNVIQTKGDIALALELASSNEYFHRTR